MNYSRRPSMGRTLARIGVAVSALAVMSLVSSCDSASSTSTEAEAEATKAVPVAVHQPYIEDAVRVLTANGSIVADRQVTIYSSVAGRVVERNVDLASSVRDSQIIITVDHSALDLTVAQTRAALAAAEQQAANLATELARVQRLYNEGGSSQQQYDAIRTQKTSADEGVKQARAAFQQAVVRRNEADIRAPFDGVIGRLFVEVGDMVGPGVPIAVVVDLTPLIGKVQIPERDLGLIYSKQPATLTVAAYPGAVFRGAVRRISPIIDPVTRMAEVEVLLPNEDRRLKPGMFARVNIEVDRRPHALMLPSDAVLQESRLRAGDVSGNVERTYYVFVKQGNKAVRRAVDLGYTTGDRVEIRSGVSAGDSVVVQGQHLVQDGQLVVLSSAPTAGGVR